MRDRGLGGGAGAATSRRVLTVSCGPPASSAEGGERGRLAERWVAFRGGLPRGRRAALGEHSTKQSRNKAGNTCTLSLSPFTPKTRAHAPAGDPMALSSRHSTSSSASRQSWKPVAAIDHPGNIFILLDIEENMSGRLLPFFFFKSYVCSFFPFHKDFFLFKTSILKHQYVEISSYPSLMLLECSGEPEDGGFDSPSFWVLGTVWWGG